MATRQDSLIKRYGPQSPFVEAYRNLRTNLMLGNSQQPMRTLAVIGARPGAGASTTAANLAITMAELWSKVVLVDCDLRRPAVHELFSVKDSGVGLSDVLAGKAELSKALVDSGVQGLRLLPAGKAPSMPTALIGSEGMRQVLKQLAETSDIVILDTPAAAVVPDAVILASHVDAALLVTRAGQAWTPAYTDLRRRLSTVQAHVLGVVLNDVRPRDDEGLTYYRDYIAAKR